MEAGFAQALGIGVGDDVNLMTNRLLQDVTDRGDCFRPAARPTSTRAACCSCRWPRHSTTSPSAGNINVDQPRAGSVGRRAESAGRRRRAVAHRACASARRRRGRNWPKTLCKTWNKGLKFACDLSIVLAVFLIFNTFLMNVGERRRQLAILRAIGTTRRQISRTLLCEGLFMGVLGTSLGALAGPGRRVSVDQRDDADLLGCDARRARDGMAVHDRRHRGPGDVAAGDGRSGLAGRQDYAAGRHAAGDLGKRRPRFLRGSSALSLLINVAHRIAAGGVHPRLSADRADDSVGRRFSPRLSCCWCIVLLRPLAQRRGLLLYPLLRVEGHLAHRQILRRRVRTALTISVLYIAVSTADLAGDDDCQQRQ